MQKVNHMDLQQRLFPEPKQIARILGIETSCDETAAAVVENGRVILSNAVSSQVELHAQFGERHTFGTSSRKAEGGH